MSLGPMYQKGQGAVRSSVLAVWWFQKAVDQKSCDAKRSFCCFHEYDSAGLQMETREYCAEFSVVPLVSAIGLLKT